MFDEHSLPDTSHHILPWSQTPADRPHHELISASMMFSSPSMVPGTPCNDEQAMCLGPSRLISPRLASPAFGTLKPKAPLRRATRIFFDSADYQLAVMQAQKGADLAQKTQQLQASTDWRALVKSNSQAAEASVPAAQRASDVCSFYTRKMATPGTQPLCRGVHSPTRLSLARS